MTNKLRAWNFYIQSRLGVKHTRDNSNFSVKNHWDFTASDLSVITNNFAVSPPWGEKVNKQASCKYSPANIKLTSKGMELWTTRNTGPDSNTTPYIASMIRTTATNHLAAFGKIEAVVEIPTFKGQWPAFWTTDSVRVLPEFDIFEFVWPGWKSEGTMEGNVHYGTSYTSSKWKYSHPSWLGLSKEDLAKPIKISAEFYPTHTLYLVNDFVVYKTKQGHSPNNKVVWLSGGTYNFEGGPQGNGPWLSLVVKSFTIYQLNEVIK